jgi:hypothetical protein
MTARSLRLTTSVFAGSLVLAGAVALPASAAPVVTGGLVNVTVTNLLNNNTVTIPVSVGAALNVAANVCGVTVGVLAAQLPGGTATCTNGAQTATATIRQITG